jgi:hypothetical protein
MKFNSDIDIDFGDREKILQHIKYTSASMRNVKPIRKHATGVYVTDIPYDSINDMANLDYTEAEKRGYIKLDFLNVHVYDKVRDELHLIELMREPNWEKLKDKDFVEKLIHVSNHYSSMQKMPESIDSMTRLAMFLAVIRPGKKHLIGRPWIDVNKTVWDKNDDGYSFKKSHSLAYAQLVVVHMNLLEELGHSLNEGN